MKSSSPNAITNALDQFEALVPDDIDPIGDLYSVRVVTYPPA
jgi:hypothetical protein